MMMALYASGVGDLLSVGAKLGVTPQKSLILLGITSSQPKKDVSG